MPIIFLFGHDPGVSNLDQKSQSTLLAHANNGIPRGRSPVLANGSHPDCFFCAMLAEAF